MKLISNIVVTTLKINTDFWVKTRKGVATLLFLLFIMKYLIVILFMLLCSPSNDARGFHVSVVGEERVIEFENKFPQIVKNEAVYIAYLQQYYKGNEDEFIKLLKR